MIDQGDTFDTNKAISNMLEMIWLIDRTIGYDEAARLLEAEYHPMLRGERPPDASFTKMMDGLILESGGV